MKCPTFLVSKSRSPIPRILCSSWSLFLQKMDSIRYYFIFYFAEFFFFFPGSGRLRPLVGCQVPVHCQCAEHLSLRSAESHLRYSRTPLFLVFANAQRIACLPLVAYGVLHTGISSQYRLGWSRVLEHPSPGLDAGAKLGLCSIWTHDSVPRTQPGRPAEQGCALLDASASLFQRRIADCCLEH